MRHGIRHWLNSARAREAAAYDTYSRIVAYPMFLMSLMFLVAFAITLSSNPNADESDFARIVMPLTWGLFAVDYAIGILISPNRLEFLKTHVAQAIALLFPPMRILMVFHVFQVLRAAPIGRGDRARVYVLYATTLLLVLSALLVVYFERQSPDSNINSFGNALWWAGETVSTVGYGDFFPVTIPGRLVAGVLFVNGVALVGVITAGLAQNFTNDDRQRAERTAADAAVGAESTATTTTTAAVSPAPAASAAAPPTSPAVSAAAVAGASSDASVTKPELAEIHARLVNLEEMLGQLAEHVSRAVAGAVTFAPPPEDADDQRRAERSNPHGTPHPPTYDGTD